MAGRVIKVSDSTYEELCKFGRFGYDTMDKVIVRLLNEAKR